MYVSTANARVKREQLCWECDGSDHLHCGLPSRLQQDCPQQHRCCRKAGAGQADPWLEVGQGAAPAAAEAFQASGTGEGGVCQKPHERGCPAQSPADRKGHKQPCQLLCQKAGVACRRSLSSAQGGVMLCAECTCPSSCRPTWSRATHCFMHRHQRCRKCTLPQSWGGELVAEHHIRIAEV